MRILLILLLGTALVLGYVLWPSNEARERRDEKLDVYREGTTDALAEANELVLYFNRLKPAAKKKKELGALKLRQSEMDRTARELLESEEVSTAEALRGLEELEQSYWELMRDSEDLRARLREMKKWKDLLDPLTAANGRLQRQLSKMSANSTDPGFSAQANRLFDESRTARSLVQNGMIEVSSSIVRGQQICEAARKQLVGLNRDMRELVELGGEVPDTGTTPDSDDG